jgi:SAM-dependent methyltransferase
MLPFFLKKVLMNCRFIFETMSTKKTAADIEKWFASDAKFDKLYPLAIQEMTARHWTPLDVAQKAADFLVVEAGAKILDIGSGVGKFCLAAAHYKADAFFYGVEQRERLVQFANAAKEKLQIENAIFMQANVLAVDFKNYDHFYFYNSFYENVSDVGRIDKETNYASSLLHKYNHHVSDQLSLKPAGTRLATFHSLEGEIPDSYHVVGTALDDVLKFWMKI